MHSHFNTRFNQADYRGSYPGVVVSTDQAGFTVAEILIAIFIFAVIVTTVFGSYRATSEQVEIVSRKRRLVEMGRNCLDRITSDLAAIWVLLPPEYTSPALNSLPDAYRIQGTLDSVGGKTFSRLRFTSFEHLPIRESRIFGIARIVYYIQSGRDGQYRLHRSDKLFPYEEPSQADPADPVLCDRVHSFAVTFFDESGQSYDTWDSESVSFGFSTPAAAEIRLELGDDYDKQVFKTRVTFDVRRGADEVKSR